MRRKVWSLFQPTTSTKRPAQRAAVPPAAPARLFVFAFILCRGGRAISNIGGVRCGSLSVGRGLLFFGVCAFPLGGGCCFSWWGVLLLSVGGAVGAGGVWVWHPPRACPSLLVGVAFGCFWCASFLRLGRLFSGLGRLFSGLGGVGCALVFRIFVSWSVPALRLVPRSPRRLPWFVCSGGRAFSVGSRWRCRVSPCPWGFPARIGLPPLALGSLAGSVVALGVPGLWVGLWLALALPRWGCRSARVVSRLLASSFLCFLSFF